MLHTTLITDRCNETTRRLRNFFIREFRPCQWYKALKLARCNFLFERDFKRRPFALFYGSDCKIFSFSPYIFAVNVANACACHCIAANVNLTDNWVLLWRMKKVLDKSCTVFFFYGRLLKKGAKTYLQCLEWTTMLYFQLKCFMHSFSARGNFISILLCWDFAGHRHSAILIRFPSVFPG